MGRPAGTSGRSQLKPEDLVRIQTLSRDAKMGPKEIERVTGYSPYQIKYAIRKKTPTVGKRTGRPPKNPADPNAPKPAKSKKKAQPAAPEQQPVVQPEQAAQAGQLQGVQRPTVQIESESHMVDSAVLSLQATE